MAWDSSRPVPWKRLLIEWAVISVVVILISVTVTKNTKPESFIAILLAGGVYLGFGAILAKMGYARKTLKQMRTEAAAAPPRKAGTGTGSGSSTRPKPAPTSRTSTGPSNRPQKKKR